MHKEAHKEQLANVKSSIDKTSITNFLKTEIEKRENTGVSVEKESTPEIIRDLLEEAKSHLGKRYRSGGKGPKVFDCSGFSSYVFRQFGVELSPSSKTQYTQGESVEINDLRSGDLVFFTGRNRKNGVGHVGIVVSADNEKGTFTFIHATISQGIKIDSNQGYYEGKYIGAKRVNLMDE